MFIPGLDRSLELLEGKYAEDAENALDVLANIIRISREDEEKTAYFPQLYRETVSEDGLKGFQLNRYLSKLEDAGLIKRSRVNIQTGWKIRGSDEVHNRRLMYITVFIPTEMAEVALAIYQ